jgi:hypothetical protein
VQVAAAVPAPVVASIPEPVIAVAAPAPIADTSTLMAVVEGAGLQWVQTAPSAVAEPEVVTPVVRAPRVRKPRAVVAAEPLMQVETGQPPKAD